MSRVADPSTSGELARYEAQKLAFAPLIFQGCRALRDFGVLDALRRAGGSGLSAREAVELLSERAAASELAVSSPMGGRAAAPSAYAVGLVLEAGFAGGLCQCDLSTSEPRFTITKAGVYWLHDELTRVNAEFVHHVCYVGAADLSEALREGVPAGLRALAPATQQATPWKTVYEALVDLSTDVRRAWFDFDHFYSNGVFEECLPRVLSAASAGKDLVDIGGNTGRFARLILSQKAPPNYTMVDLPGQLATAKSELAALGERVNFLALDVLDVGASFPESDVFWMSQFLDCFSEPQILSILQRVRRALRPGGTVFVLETFWDQQRYEAARHCVIGTSLYFACIANGDSRMYHSAVMERLIREAGLVVRHADHKIGISHSLLTCGLPE